MNLTFRSCIKLLFLLAFLITTHFQAQAFCLDDGNGEINGTTIRRADDRFYVSSNTQSSIGVFNLIGPFDVCAMQFASVAADADGIHYDEDNDVLYQLNRTDNVIDVYTNVVATLRQGNEPQIAFSSTSDFSNGREIAVSGNKLVVAQDANSSNGGNRLVVYNISPTSITLASSFAVGINLWGIHATNQTLFAVVDNSNELAVFNNFFSQTGSSIAPDRIVTVEGIVRTHGLTYSVRANRMLMTDVGAAGDPTDGAVVIINDFYEAISDGVVTASEQFRIAGSRTLLGNPVDVAYVRKTAMIYVAERANGGGRVLGFPLPPTAFQAGNVSPWYNQDYAGASAITIGNQEDEVDTDGMLSKRVYVSSNNAGAVGVYNSLSNGNGTLTSFPVRAADADGIAYVSGRDRLYQVNRTAGRVDAYGGVEFSLNNNINPSFRGDSPFSIRNGRGIAVSGNQIVAAQDANDSNAGNRFIVYGINGDNIQRTRTVEVGINLWGIDLDGETLYAVIDNSNRVAVFNNFLSETGTGTSANASFSVTDLVRTHGIRYVAGQDMMLLTDIGSAGSSTDGAFIVIRNFTQAAADGRITRNEQIRVGGSNTFLGNPVDIDYCPMDNRVYIAERASGGGRLLAFVLPMAGSSGGNLRPVVNRLFSGASSVAIGNTMMMGGRGGNDLVMDNTHTTQTANTVLDMTVFPNPVIEQVNVKWIQAAEVASINLQITTATGQIISRQLVDAVEGINNYTVNVADLPAGMYHLSVINAGGVTTHTFVKK